MITTSKLIITTLCCVLLLASAEQARAKCHNLNGLVSNGGWIVETGSGLDPIECNPNKTLIPASIIKVVTALAAMEILGESYRFKTEFSLDSGNNLYIKGFGDPLLTSEEALDIVGTLRHAGISSINNIFIDNSAFALEHRVPGREYSDNPYDAPLGATMVNFNTIPIRIDKYGNISSDDDKTPTMPIMFELGKKYRKGHHLINICPGGCKEEKRIARLSSELFYGQMQKVGIEVTGGWQIRQTPNDAQLIYTHYNSSSLPDVLSGMLKYSNNLTANQVYLAIGAARYGYPATWEKANRAMQNFIEETIGSKYSNEFHMVEGSGLSRKNKVTPRSMLEIMKQFKPYSHLLATRQQIKLKSGTMKNIYNYAGYMDDGMPFVLMLNQSKNSRKQVLQFLKEQEERHVLATITN